MVHKETTARKKEIANYAERVKDIDETDMEITWIKLEIPGTKTTDFIGCYYVWTTKKRQER